MDGLIARRDPASRRDVLLWGLVAFASSGLATTAQAARPGSFASLDGDRDGTIDLDEARRAGELVFQRLDRRKTGKLTRSELGRHRVTREEFAWADRDHDGTLDKNEYLALVERQFKAADRNGNGKITRAEFHARSGLPLRRLLY